jgi:hypothetical protein
MRAFFFWDGPSSNALVWRSGWLDSMNADAGELPEKPALVDPIEVGLPARGLQP